MNTKTTIGIFAAVAILAAAMTPTLITQASAKQTATITCTQQTGAGPNTSTGPCSGSSAENNPNRAEACTASNAGQQKKLC